jgi:predicted DCC family thiol-disulfide oxidoreductase YuxK
MPVPAERRVANPPPRPLLLFDGDCGFCRGWIARWRPATKDRVDYAPSSPAGERFPEIPPEEFRRAVQLVLPDGRVLSGARAVAAALAEAGGVRRWPLVLYERLPGAAPVAEAAYGLVARHRRAASAVTRVLWGSDPSDLTPPTFGVAGAIWLRLLGAVFFCAFVSVGWQIRGLAGSRGIAPIAPLLSAVADHFGAERFWLLPTLSWAAPGDTALVVQCVLGAALSLVLAAGFVPAIAAALCTLLYLSVSVAGQVFFYFQWDSLLVEAGFLSVFLAPLGRRAAFPAGGPSRVPLFLLRWLLFRLNFSSGVVKLASGDPTWRNLTALSFHYETQPLPPWTAWWMHQLPGAFHRASCVFLFFVELVVPFAIFGPRRLRHAACVLLASLQVFIAATGNYAYFNLLAVALCVLLVDDVSFERLRTRVRLGRRSASASVSSGRPWPAAVSWLVAAVVLPVSLAEVVAPLRPGRGAIPGISGLARAVAPLRIVNGYGLFAVMTTRRPEIVLEGSEDGRTWKEYAFRWKPGDPNRRPAFVAPHQPRLDWQMWFAALGSREENPWLDRLLVRLLEGSPDVLALLGPDPFSGRRPRFVRARLYDYRFTDRAERRRTGAWWRRVELEDYSPVYSSSPDATP